MVSRRGHLVEQVGELGLALFGEQEIVERSEAAALVGAGDLRAAADQIGEQFALGTVPGGDLLARGPVQQPEVVLDLAEVRKQLTRGRRQLLVAVTNPGGVQHRHVAGLHGGDLGVDLGASPMQFGQPHFGLQFGAVHDLAQQFDHGVQAGLGADEGSALQAVHPGVGLLERRGDLVVDFVVAWRIEPAADSRRRWPPNPPGRRAVPSDIGPRRRSAHTAGRPVRRRPRLPSRRHGWPRRRIDRGRTGSAWHCRRAAAARPDAGPAPQ